MPRGRPPKNKKPTDSNNKLNKNVEIKAIEPPRQKRKYTKRQKVPKNIAEDDTVIKLEAKKRGRKRGRKKKDQELTFRSEEVVDYMIRNYPHMGIERIREKVLDGLKVMKDINDEPYRLYGFVHKKIKYYYDDNDAILNTDGVIIGYFIKQEDQNKKMYMLQQNNTDIRTFEQVINSIERK